MSNRMTRRILTFIIACALAVTLCAQGVAQSMTVYTASDNAKVYSAHGVQIGTRFIATEECDADPGFKQAIVDAKEDDALIIQSPVGMPARAVNSPLLKRLAEGERYPAVRCNNCLEACPKGDKTPYCISRALVAAVKGNWEDGLFFTGGNVGRVNKIVPVKELIEDIIGEPLPAPQGA